MITTALLSEEDAAARLLISTRPLRQPQHLEACSEARVKEDQPCQLAQPKAQKRRRNAATILPFTQRADVRA